MPPTGAPAPRETRLPAYFDVPGVATVTWEATTATVLVEWDGWANSVEFQTLLEAELKALQDNHGSSLLIDCRRQRRLLRADLDRADRDWLPRAAAAGLTKFAIVLPTSDPAAVELRNREAEFQKSMLQVQYFATPEEARRWLAA